MNEPIAAVRAVITGEQELGFEAFEVPAPRGSEIAVELLRTIISAGTELANYTGLDPDTRIPGRWCTYPWAPGYGGIGRIVAAGPDVKNLKVGDRIYSRFHHGNIEEMESGSQFCVRVPESLDST